MQICLTLDITITLLVLNQKHFKPIADGNAADSGMIVL